ncbi:unnamed protein product [Protopolystoma xenopodis]|uniref:Uncharacterized protein n=1 Tax=Protopolystoma xenopodis TaxID=117903 RepID=A0A3S5B116_9PLAT|nr:unnamed protein product [Protopolystoma xenopodis]
MLGWVSSAHLPLHNSVQSALTGNSEGEADLRGRGLNPTSHKSTESSIAWPSGFELTSFRHNPTHLAPSNRPGALKLQALSRREPMPGCNMRSVAHLRAIHPFCSSLPTCPSMHARVYVPCLDGPAGMLTCGHALLWT